MSQSVIDTPVSETPVIKTNKEEQRRAQQQAYNDRSKRFRLLGQYLQQLINEGKFPDPGDLKIVRRKNNYMVAQAI